MKEATGEANLTILIIALIGVIATFGAILIPRLMKNSNNKSCCLENDGIIFNNKCYVKESCNTNSSTGKTTNCTQLLDAKC